MSICMEELNDYLKQRPIRYGYDGIDSLLELLRCVYTENNPVENAVIRHKFMKIDQILSQLTLKENDAVFDLICQLCAEYASRSFSEGLHIGLRLSVELLEA